MAANWIKFVADVSNFLSSKSSSGPVETGDKLAGFYLQAIRTSQTPTANFFGQTPGDQALRSAWSAVFQKLAQSSSPSVEEKKKDPAFDPEPERPIPDFSEGSTEFDEDFRQFLRDEKRTSFLFFELSVPQSEYILETDPNVISSFGLNESDRKKYNSELEIFQSLKEEFLLLRTQQEEEEVKTNEPKEKDPYDELASAIILFWTISGPVAFQPVPPIPPATEPLPGTYQIIYPGDPWTLAKSLRKAFNLGLNEKFNDDPTGILSANAISNALADAFSIHLASLKFIYNGTISGVPIVSIVPLIF
jgi:hypothetical protein